MIRTSLHRQMPHAHPVVIGTGIYGVPDPYRLHITSAWGILDTSTIALLFFNVENGDPANDLTLLRGKVHLRGLDLVVAPTHRVQVNAGGLQGWLEPNFG